jgi:hypothetical protein
MPAQVSQRLLSTHGQQKPASMFLEVLVAMPPLGLFFCLQPRLEGEALS